MKSRGSEKRFPHRAQKVCSFRLCRLVWHLWCLCSLFSIIGTIRLITQRVTQKAYHSIKWKTKRFLIKWIFFKIKSCSRAFAKWNICRWQKHEYERATIITTVLHFNCYLIKNLIERIKFERLWLCSLACALSLLLLSVKVNTNMKKLGESIT